MIGLGDLAIYREDKNYEYFYAPNQDVYRFGNHIVTNEFGMRSKPVNKKKKITILEFGDSVLNGGAHVDQEKLATTIEENELNKFFNNQVQILNVSAQSWGVSNAFAFLKKHGDFNADIIVLTFSSHDLNDNMHFKKVVGEHPAWPAEKPFLALTDAWSRFIWPPIQRIFTGENEYEYLNDFDDTKINNGWKSFFKYCAENKIPLIVYLHASEKEVNGGKYNSLGEKILKVCSMNKIQVIKDLKFLKNEDEVFIDQIHLNENGHKIMANLLMPKLNQLVSLILN
jgi:lysophospholipase L1-like esterase